MTFDVEPAAPPVTVNDASPDTGCPSSLVTCQAIRYAPGPAFSVTAAVTTVPATVGGAVSTTASSRVSRTLANWDAMVSSKVSWICVGPVDSCAPSAGAIETREA